MQTWSKGFLLYCMTTGLLEFFFFFLTESKVAFMDFLWCSPDLENRTGPGSSPVHTKWTLVSAVSQKRCSIPKPAKGAKNVLVWFYELRKVQIRQSNEMEVDVGCVDACHSSNEKLEFHTERVCRNGLYNGTGNFWQPCCFFGACSEMKDCLYRTVWRMFAQRFTVIKLNGLFKFGLACLVCRVRSTPKEWLGTRQRTWHVHVGI